MPDVLSPDFSFLLAQQHRLLDELRGIREDYRTLVTSLPAVLERTREQDKRFDEIERRLGVLADDLATKIRVEIGSAVVHLETRLEQL